MLKQVEDKIKNPVAEIYFKQMRCIQGGAYKILASNFLSNNILFDLQ